MNFKQTAKEDIDNIIEQAIEESSKIDSIDLAENINVTFDIIDKKLKEFFDE